MLARLENRIDRRSNELGFNIWLRNERLRLYRIDAPETRGASKQAGIASTKALTEKIKGKRVTICTVKDHKGKYGRYLATIWLDDVNVNAWLVDRGLISLFRTRAAIASQVPEKSYPVASRISSTVTTAF